mgnify:CR=1 FL=1
MAKKKETQEPVFYYQRKLHTVAECRNLLAHFSLKLISYKNMLKGPKGPGFKTLEEDITHRVEKLERLRSDLESFLFKYDRQIAESKANKAAEPTPQPDRVNRPSHYTSHPSGVECITITEHYDFCVGNAIKYLWRCGLKVEEGMTPKDKEVEDLKKAIYYINRKLNNLQK